MSLHELATQITIAAMQVGSQSNAGDKLHRANEVASFYETIYQKITEMDQKRKSGTVI